MHNEERNTTPEVNQNWQVQFIETVASTRGIFILLSFELEHYYVNNPVRVGPSLAVYFNLCSSSSFMFGSW